ncbi:MAG: hypothetical protein K8E24_003170 [Methanobacterium paludis]|nr:hypothetical protein [Methanobacterium paludis]
MQNAIENKYKEVLDNPHGFMVFMIPTSSPDTKVEVKFEKLSVDVKESSFRLYRQDNRDEVIAAHRMDPYRINAGRTGSLGGNTSVESKKNYKTGVAKPEQRRLEAFINIYVIWDENGFNIQDWKLKLEEIDTEDESHEMDMDKALFLMGARRPIDLIKKWENKTGITVPKELENHPALNAYYVNNYPITLDQPDTPETEAVIKILENLKNEVEGVVEKYDKPNDGRSSGKGGRLHRAVKEFTI